jgi:hypothetical protein
MSSNKKIVITDKEWGVLIEIRGMPDNVHSMVYSASHAKNNQVLKGSDEDFDDLLDLISEEIGVGLCPKKNIKILMGICKKIDANSIEWMEW